MVFDEETNQPTEGAEAPAEGAAPEAPAEGGESNE